MIKLQDNYLIDSDNNCYTLKIDKNKTDKNNKPIYEILGYYGTLKDALNGYCRHKVLEYTSTHDVTLKELQCVVIALYEEIRKVNA